MAIENLTTLPLKQEPVIRPRKFWIIIGAYLLSFVFWYPAWAMLAFFIWEDSGHLLYRHPEMEPVFLWLWIYPITVVIGVVSAAIAYFFRRRCILIGSFLFPLIVAGFAFLAYVGVLISGQIEERQQINTFWNGPPRQISSFNLDGTELEDPSFVNVFILPKSVKETDIESWDGRTLTFETEMSPDEVEDFYLDAYRLIGFHMRSFGGGNGYRSVDYDFNKTTFFTLTNKHLTLRISNKSDQLLTRVRISACHEIQDCWRSEERNWDR